MSNIVDAFSVTALYNSIMKDCTESLMGAIPWGFLYTPRRLTDGRFCEEHAKAEAKRYEKYDRDPAVRRRYGRAWKRIRDSYVQQHPLCEVCQKDGRLVAAEEVHHKVPLSEGGTHARDNLIALCKSCHARIHAERGDRWHNS